MTWDKINELIDLAQRPVERSVIPNHNPERWNYWRFFYLLAKEMKASLCCEIGIESGYGSRNFAAAGADVIAIDIQHSIECKNVFSIVGDSEDEMTLKQASLAVEYWDGIDILYQDSSHHYNPSKREWEIYRPLMKPGGIWICDDITPAFYNPNPHPSERPHYQDPIGKGMVQYFEEIPEKNKRLFPNVLHKGNIHGIILL